MWQQLHTDPEVRPEIHCRPQAHNHRDDMKAVIAILLVLCDLSISQAWKCSEPPQLYSALQIDAGLGKVVAIDRNYNAYFLSGETWLRLGSHRLKHVSVGPAGTWGVDTSNRVYKYVAGHFRQSRGNYMQQVDAGGNGQVVGVSSSWHTFCLRSTIASAYNGAGILRWSSLSRVMKYYSCGKYGCWGIDLNNRIYFTKILVPTTCGSSGWTHIGGAAKMVEVGTDGNVFVVNRFGGLFQRTGISARRPQGTGWHHIKMCVPIHHVTYDLGRIWAMSNRGFLLLCTH